MSAKILKNSWLRLPFFIYYGAAQNYINLMACGKIQQNGTKYVLQQL